LILYHFCFNTQIQMVSILSLQYTNKFKFFMQFCFANISERLMTWNLLSTEKLIAPTWTFSLNRIKQFYSIHSPLPWIRVKEMVGFSKFLWWEVFCSAFILFKNGLYDAENKLLLTNNISVLGRQAWYEIFKKYSWNVLAVFRSTF
jgi:hypothetical protein